MLSMQKLSILLIAIFGSCSIVFAQDGLPEAPQDGNCYAKCVTPDEYVDESVTVMVQPAYQTLEIVPAQYKTVIDSILIRPASKKFTYVPATYKTVRDTQIIKDGFTRLAVLGESFTASSEVVTIKPAIGKWEMGPQLTDCESADPNDCRTLCYREYPAVTRAIPTKVLERNQTTNGTNIAAEYRVITREVEVTPARMQETVIPAKYTTITRQVLVKDETTVATQIAAVYETVQVQRLSQKGGLTYWKEVSCSLPQIGEILPIQYEVGSARLTPESKRIIDEKLYQFMSTHVNSRIELSAHTDSRGSAASNMNLSRQRANSVVNYLVSKGISSNRLVAQGKGETELTNECADGVSCPEYKHQANRRTTFRILNY